MANSPDTDTQYTITVPPFAQDMITGYRDMDPWYNQTSDIMRGIIMGTTIARSQAISHRNFTVGACGLALRQATNDGSHIYQAFHGANEKPAADGNINIHAEQEVIAAARRHGATLTAMVLYGDNQPDQGTGVAFPAIVPCSAVCLPMLQSAAAIDHRLTLFSSLSPDRKQVMLYTLPSLAAAYNQRNPDILYTAEFSREIGLFDPAETDRSVNSLTEEAHSVFDDEFTVKISSIVLAHLQCKLS